MARAAVATVRAAGAMARAVVARGLAGGLRQRHLGVRARIPGIGLLRAAGVGARAGGREAEPVENVNVDSVCEIRS